MSATEREPAKPLAGTTAVVTGGGRGLGRITALALAAAGAAVGIIARSAGELEETVGLIEAQSGTAMAHSADVSNEDQIGRAIQEVRRVLGPVDVLVNNAGVNGPISAFTEVDPQEWWRAVEINLGGAVRCSWLVLPDMVARGRGRIVNVTSVAGTYRWPLVSAYSVSKAALVKFTENLAAEVRRDGVSVFSFHPGLLRIGLAAAGLNGGLAPAGSALAKIQEWAQRQQAAGRFSDPKDAADYIAVLASGKADPLSGRHLTVHDNLDMMLERLEDIERLDLHTLRLREAAMV
jgi:NAD(P)-dependent dehydrogenase (short-subunit alcohol dehydrogenase family)